MGALELESRPAQEGALAAANSSALQQQAELQALRQQLKGAEASSKAQAAKLKEEQARVAAAEQQVNECWGYLSISLCGSRHHLLTTLWAAMLASGAPGCSLHHDSCRPGQHWQHVAPAQSSVGRWECISF